MVLEGDLDSIGATIRRMDHLTPSGGLETKSLIVEMR